VTINCAAVVLLQIQYKHALQGVRLRRRQVATFWRNALSPSSGLNMEAVLIPPHRFRASSMFLLRVLGKWVSTRLGLNVAYRGIYVSLQFHERAFSLLSPPM
jgi:hypothetical protein